MPAECGSTASFGVVVTTSRMANQTERPKATREQLDQYARLFNASATMKHFGVTLSFPGAEQVRADLPIQPEQRGGLGGEAVNGGVLAAVFGLVVRGTP